MIDGQMLIRETKRALRSVVPTPILNWREVQYYDRYGEVELQLLQYLCRPDRDSIDVGANDGSYVHFMRRYSRRVIAFEPLPWYAQKLVKRFRHGVVVHDFALSRSAGLATLRIPLLDDLLIDGCSSISPQAAEHYPAFREVEVRMDTLDNVYDGEVGFIKIDVEGHEEAVLDGAQGTIARCRPKMLVEIDERLSPDGVRRATEFFADLGYRGHFIFNRRLLPLEQFDRNIMQRPENLPDLKARLDQRERFGAYIYNFIFLPDESPVAVLHDMEARLARL
jgi:FkbM family methyltransferase